MSLRLATKRAVELSLQDTTADDDRQEAILQILARESSLQSSSSSQPPPLPLPPRRKSVAKKHKAATTGEAQPSKHVGVMWNKEKQKWRAHIKIDGKQTHLGYFDNEKDAARKFDKQAARIGKPMNFPKKK